MINFEKERLAKEQADRDRVAQEQADLAAAANRPPSTPAVPQDKPSTQMATPAQTAERSTPGPGGPVTVGADKPPVQTAMLTPPGEPSHPKSEQPREANSFDGYWSIMWTGVSDCRRASGTYSIDIQGGTITSAHPGRVSSSGAANWNSHWNSPHARNGGSVASKGTLSGDTGSGLFKNTLGCQGTFVAKKIENVSPDKTSRAGHSTAVKDRLAWDPYDRTRKITPGGRETCGPRGCKIVPIGCHAVRRGGGMGLGGKVFCP